MSEPSSRVREQRDFLRRLPLFAELAEPDVTRLCRMARRLRVAAGDVVMAEGTPGDGLYVVLDGELEVTKRENGREVPLAARGPGEFLGEMSLLEQAPRSATVRALRDSELLVIDPASLQELLSASPAAAATILRTMAARLRSTESSLMEQEKLASLGTLAAGLAHELNNPAAAIRRTTQHLRQSLDAWREASAALGAVELSPPAAAALAELQSPRPTAGRTALESAEAEERVGAWLEEGGVADPWELAPTLVAAGWDDAALQAALAAFPETDRAVVLRWLAAGLETDALLGEIGASAEAIATIVGAVRSYAYLDRAPVQDVDVRESIETTLVILRHKLKHGVTVETDYAADLPRIEAYGSELNQVWTNLIDNAIAAMEGKGVIRIGARRRGDHVVVDIADTGPGVPESLRSRIFDPFFTTKGPGQGTGLGLHIARNIVVNRHRGRLDVENDGGARFTVALPLRLSTHSA